MRRYSKGVGRVAINTALWEHWTGFLSHEEAARGGLRRAATLSDCVLASSHPCNLRLPREDMTGNDWPGWGMRRVCTGTPVQYEQTVRERVARPGRRVQRVCTGTPVYQRESRVSVYDEAPGCRIAPRGYTMNDQAGTELPDPRRGPLVGGSRLPRREGHASPHRGRTSAWSVSRK